jgi:hypothetical protein
MISALSQLNYAMNKKTFTSTDTLKYTKAAERSSMVGGDDGASGFHLSACCILMQPMKVLVASEGRRVVISTNIHVRQNNYMTGGNTAKYAGVGWGGVSRGRLAELVHGTSSLGLSKGLDIYNNNKTPKSGIFVKSQAS